LVKLHLLHFRDKIDFKSNHNQKESSMEQKTISDIVKESGLTDLQARIYVHLIKSGQQTPNEIAKALQEHRTTVYSAVEKLTQLDIAKKEIKGKIAAYAPNHPSSLELLAEKRLRIAARQTKTLARSFHDLINFYNEHQHAPGITTYYGTEGAQLIRHKILDENATLYFIRSPYDTHEDPESILKYIEARIKKNIHAESISPSDHTKIPKDQTTKWLQTRTLLPPKEYDSPVEIAIFGDKVAFIDHSQNAMSTLIDSPNIANAMKQFFQFAKKHIERSTDQPALLSKVEQTARTTRSSSPPSSQTLPSHQTFPTRPHDTLAPRHPSPNSQPQSPSPADHPDAPPHQN
jgi:sugar-specific transcriptional regulator TrmB